MTTHSDPSASDPQMIGNAFVKQFYTILHKEPAQAYKFYLDLSVLSRPGPDGVMKTVTSLKVSFYLHKPYTRNHCILFGSCLQQFTELFGNY